MVARPQGASPEAGSATFNVALEAWGRRAGTEAEKETQKGRAVEKGEMKREGEMQGGESGKTRNYRETANKTEARGVHRTMFVILHRDFFHNFFFVK